MPANSYESASSRSSAEAADIRLASTSPLETLTKEQICRAYDRYAPFYDHLFGAVYAHGHRRLAQALRILAPRRALEVGVGTGLTLNCYPATTDLVGIDLSEAMLARARRRASKLGLANTTLQAMNGESTSFADASFDCITLPYVLSATPEPARLVRELRRICRPQGHILILNHFSGSRFWRLLERAVQPLSAKIGFRSDFHFEEHIACYDWKVLSVESANPFGLSRLVLIQNT